MTTRTISVSTMPTTKLTHTKLGVSSKARTPKISSRSSTTITKKVQLFVRHFCWSVFNAPIRTITAAAAQEKQQIAQKYDKQRNNKSANTSNSFCNHMPPPQKKACLKSTRLTFVSLIIFPMKGSYGISCFD